MNVEDALRTQKPMNHIQYSDIKAGHMPIVNTPEGRLDFSPVLNSQYSYKELVNLYDKRNELEPKSVTIDGKDYTIKEYNQLRHSKLIRSYMDQWTGEAKPKIKDEGKLMLLADQLVGAGDDDEETRQKAHNSLMALAIDQGRTRFMVDALKSDSNIRREIRAQKRLSKFEDNREEFEGTEPYKNEVGISYE